MSVEKQIENLTRGVYRNRVGAELHVLNPVIRVREYRLLDSDIWEAEAVDPLFGSTDYLVTVHSMNSSGYELVTEEPA